MKKTFDLEKQPLIAVWEMNHKRNESSGQGSAPGEALELTVTEAEQLIRDVAELKPPVFVFAGANPLKYNQILSLVRYAASSGLHPDMIVSADPSLTRQTLAHLKSAGLSRLGLVLQGASQGLHESATGVGNSFAYTVKALQWANELRLPVQIHTDIYRNNLQDLESMADLLKGFRILSWTLAFPPTARANQPDDILSAEEFELVFERIYAIAQQVPFKIKTAEAEHYRRFVVQQHAKAKGDSNGRSEFDEDGIPGILPINQSRASMYITSTGEVYPSGYLAASGGNVRRQKLAEIYRDSDIFKALRDPGNLKGKCGQCEFKQLCGGSRGRAFVQAGDMFAQDDSCVYQPASLRPPLVKLES